MGMTATVRAGLKNMKPSANLVSPGFASTLSCQRSSVSSSGLSSVFNSSGLADTLSCKNQADRFSCYSIVMSKWRIPNE